ncbi:hypothetical protein G5B47_18345 [Paenibacillus sp. 7124]|uniref:Polyketide cyclase / dehydrase and lipid transport n=1 Tax=Paenibacillus apii TaxID=1850370 RepID=A0A6M1PRJ1_9BACL|nr:hypothetical protein [Paenibacillus apii]NGM84373.1 hypothetical protein [Paenibacillus apii]
MELSFSNELIIDCTVARVYEFLRNVENFSSWNYAVMTVEPTGDRKDTYRLTRDLVHSQEIETITVIEARTDQFLHLQAAGGRFDYESKYELKTFENKTLLANHVIMKPSGASGILLKLLKGNIQREVNNNLHVLKTLMEENGSTNIKAKELLL